jgi:hypothetical protein
MTSHFVARIYVGGSTLSLARVRASLLHAQPRAPNVAGRAAATRLFERPTKVVSPCTLARAR